MKSRLLEESAGAHSLVDIVDLRTLPWLTDQVAGWLHQEWYSQRGIAQVQDRLRAGHPDRRFPATFVARVHEQPVGTFTLEEAADPLTGLPLFCLSNVFVEKTWRGQSIGRQLCEAAVEQTCALRIPRLSLFTASHAAFYAELGWRYVNVVLKVSRNGEVAAMLMRRDVYLGETASSRAKAFPCNCSTHERNPE